MEDFDSFSVGSIPAFLSVGNERAGTPPCSLYHSDPYRSGTFPVRALDKEVGPRSRSVCWCVRGRGLG